LQWGHGYGIVKEKGEMCMNWYSVVLLAVLAIGGWFLYDNGYMITKSKTALTFIGSGIGRSNYFNFQFTGCTGYAGRVLRVKESGTFTVSLNANLSKGSVRFSLLDEAKTPLLVLTPEQNQGRVSLEPGKRYHIRMEFDHASGDSKACWERN
jgi:hypothetical protein